MALTEFGFLQKTAISFKASGGDATWTPSSTTGDQAGRRSARYDLGVTSTARKPRRYLLRAKMTNGGSTGTLGRAIFIYLITSNSSTGAAGTDGQQAETDAALSGSDARRNLKPVMVLVCDATAAGSIYEASQEILISERYIQFAHWNDLGVSISSTAADHEITLTPVPDAAE